MVSQKPKPYTISFPFTAKTAEDIDQNFDVLFKQVALNAPTAGLLPVTLGGTGVGAFVKGDLLYASTATTIAGLNDIATGNVLLSGGVNTAPSYGKVGLTTHVSGVLPEANGGTNQSTYAQGDLIYASAANTLAKLAKNTSASRYLSNTGASNAPAWAQVDLTNGVTGTLPVTSGGTGLATIAQGDLLYGSAANTLSALAKNTSATRYLSNTGTSNNPAWAQVDLTNGVTGTLPVANGGTNLASYTSGDLIYATGATTLAKLGIGAANRVLRSDGTAPNWGQITNAFIVDVAEDKITDGAILARVAADETITGAWTYSSTTPLIKFLESDAAANAQKWRLHVDGGQFALQVLSDNEVTANSALVVTRSGSTISVVNAAFPWEFSSSVDVADFLRANGRITGRNPGDTLHVRPNSGSAGYVTFTENLVADRWGLGIDAADATLYLRSTNSTGTVRQSWTATDANFAVDALPSADNTYDCGNATFRWALVRGVTITPGDILFENGWVITESDKYGIETPGLVILDANDDLVAFIEEGGRLYADVRPLAALPAFVKTTLEQRTGRGRP
jgi:hypothetical protein